MTRSRPPSPGSPRARSGFTWSTWTRPSAGGATPTLLASVVGKLDVKVEMSGGIRDDASLERALATGCARVNIGTAAMENPDWVREIIARHGEKVAIGLDVRGRTLAARGWTKEGGDLYEALERLDSEGCARYVITDVLKDGMLRGPNLDLLPRRLLADQGPGGRERRRVVTGRPARAGRPRRRSASRGRSSARPCTPARSRCPRPSRRCPHDRRRPRHPLPRRRRRAGGQGRQLREPARRRRSGRAGRALRRRGRGRADVPRHHRLERRPRHHVRRGPQDRRAGVHPAHRRRRRPRRSPTWTRCCARAPTRCR